MKKLILSLMAILVFAGVRADEGMWIPMLIGKNYEEMQRLGLKLSAEDIYSINRASLKDAIVHFGGGCTGEMISANGLLITNHHCGYGNIAELSTVENNYLENGFWANSYKEELPAKGLEVKYLVRAEDVTKYVLPAKKGLDQKKTEAYIASTSAKIAKDASANGKYQAQVVPFFAGNQYILLIYQVYTDVRLVGTPPKSLGKFGGDTDNWMWPRHTADFSMFRVYADASNNPAPYNSTNVPFRPKKYLPVSIAGVQDKDFAMIMGYPGRTNRYATSYEVDMAVNEVNPSIVAIRDAKLAIMRKYMRQDKAINLKLASKYASISNYWKYFIGQTEQLKRLKVIDQKRKEEQDYAKWAKDHNMDAGLMTKFAQTFAAYRPYAKYVVYYSEGFNGAELPRLAASTYTIKELLSHKKVDRPKVDKAVKALKDARTKMMEDYVPAVEREIFAKTMEMIYTDLPKAQLPQIYSSTILPGYGSKGDMKTFTAYANYVSDNSFLMNDQKFEQFVRNPSLEVLENDPATQYAYSFMDNFKENFQEKYTTYISDKTQLGKTYMAGLMKKNAGKLMYPDANSTMRLSYGSVGGYNPADAVYYNYYTTLDGLMAKYKPGDYEFDLKDDFIKLAKSKDFGQYANADGELVTGFITNNDITGGNSGSPVMNANGQLIGLAFDGNWEAMSGDIAFDKKYKRTIAVDIRFVLWIIEKYGKATNLINEMDLRR